MNTYITSIVFFTLLLLYPLHEEKLIGPSGIKRCDVSALTGLAFIW